MQNEKFFSTPCRTLCRLGAKILTVNGTDNPLTAFSKLKEEGYLSAPCKGADGKYIGFLEMRDFVAFICFSHSLQDAEKKEEDKLRKLCKVIHARLDVHGAVWPMWAANVHDKLAKYDGTPSSPDPDPATIHPVAQTINCEYLAKRHKFVRVSPEDPISKIVFFLSTAGVRRVAVVNADGSILDIVSQSTLLKYLASHKSEISEVLAAPCDTLGSSPVIVVKHDDSAYHAFDLMNQHSLHGIAIIDDKGKVVGNTSASDIKLFLRAPHLDLKTTNVFDMVSLVRAETPYAVAPVVKVSPSAHLEEAMEKLVATRKHRIFVVDSEGLPKRVISLTDIIGWIEANYTFAPQA